MPVESTERFSVENGFLKLGTVCLFIVKLKVVSFTVRNTNQSISLHDAVKENAWAIETFKTATINPATPFPTNLGRPSSPLVREVRHFALNGHRPGLANRWRAPRYGGRVFILKRLRQT